MHHIFFMHSYMHVHFICLLSIVHSHRCINIFAIVHSFTKSRMTKLNHMVILFSVLCRNPKVVSRQATQVYTLTYQEQAVCFSLHTLCSFLLYMPSFIALLKIAWLQLCKFISDSLSQPLVYMSGSVPERCYFSEIWNCVFPSFMNNGHGEMMRTTLNSQACGSVARSFPVQPSQ